MKRARLDRLLLPEVLISVPVFTVSLAWMVLFHFVDTENYANLGRPLERAVLLVAIQFIAFSVPALAYFSLRTRLRSRALTVTLLIALAIGVTLRALALDRGLSLIAGEPFEQSGLRLMTSILNVTLAFVIVWVVFSVVEMQRRSRQRLLEEHDLVVSLREQAHAQIDQMDARAAEEIRTTLLKSVAIPSGEGAKTFEASVRRLIDDVVRPLSRYFEQQSGDWLPPPPVRRSLGLNWRSVWRPALQPDRIHPVLISCVLVWTSLPNTLANRGGWIALASVLQLTLLGIPLLSLTRWIAARYVAARSRQLHAAAFFVALYIGGQILGLTSIAYTRFQEPRFFYAIATPIYVVIAGVIIALAQSAIEQSRAIDDQLRASNEDLRWSLARARETHRAQQRALAHALHGTVQAALASAILRLETSNRSGADRDELARVIADSLKATITDVEFLVSEAEPLDVVVHRISDTWEGIASISAEVESGLGQRLAMDPVCAIAVNDLLTELTFNSIKHGSASQIGIELRCPTARILEVIVTDNGSELVPDLRRGMGSALLDDCAISWKRTRAHGKTCSAALLPIQ